MEGDMELTTLHRRAVEHWAARVAAVQSDQWGEPTPCTEWSVRELVNHVVGEELWTAPLLRGKTIDEAAAIVDEIVPGGGRVLLSYGEEDMDEYVRQLCADHLIHGWDLAAATDGDTSMDPELMAEVGAWFAAREPMYRSAGVVGPRPPGTDDPQSDLLAGFGRDSRWAPHHAAP